MFLPLPSCDAATKEFLHIGLDIRQEDVNPSQCSFCRNLVSTRSEAIRALTNQEGGVGLHPCRRVHDYKPHPDPPRFQIQSPAFGTSVWIRTIPMHLRGVCNRWHMTDHALRRSVCAPARVVQYRSSSLHSARSEKHERG